MIKFRADSRSKRWSVSQTFGQVPILDFPTEFRVREQFADYIQPVGDVKCTCITCCDIASDKDGVQYDHNDLFSRIKSDSSGAIPQDALNETIKVGLTPVGQTLKITPFKSYYEAHSGSYDAFDSVRSALMKMNYPVAVWTRWYREWTSQILPEGQNAISGHMYDIDGWKLVNGEPMLIASVWTGEERYISRAVFNKAVGVWGCGTAVLSTLDINIDRKKTILEALIDAIKNLIILLQEQAMKEKTKSNVLYDIAYSLIGKHLTLDESVPKEFGCAQAMSYVLKQAGYNIPDKGISSTNELNKWLAQNCTEVTEPQKGDIIISVSFTGLPNARGHVGIVGEKAIMSNASDTGEWQPWWSLKAWLDFYKVQKKLATKYYRVV